MEILIKWAKKIGVFLQVLCLMPIAYYLRDGGAIGLIIVVLAFCAEAFVGNGKKQGDSNT